MGDPLPGQLTVYDGVPGVQRHGSGEAFFAGPGDPEDFLFRDDIDAIVEKLERTGSRTLYVQMVRSHGGDGPAHHNPFREHDPANGVDPGVLDRWHDILRRLANLDVDVFLFFYDDSASPWEDEDAVPPAEAVFIRAVVDRFQDLTNIVWVVAEEYSEAMTAKKAGEIARIIFEQDHRRHPIGVHKLAGTTFEEFAGNPHISVFLAQLPELTPLALHDAALRLRDGSGGRYQPVMSEMAEWPAGEPARRLAWESAMAGVPVLAYTYDVATTEVDDLRALARLQALFEQTRAHTFRPAGDRSVSEQQRVLADPIHGRWLVYSPDVARERERSLGVRDALSATFDLTWVEIGSDRRIVEVREGPGVFAAPERFSGDVALYMSRRPHSEFPGAAWNPLSPGEAGIPRQALERLTNQVGGNGCVLRFGRMVHCWGEHEETSDWASIAKPVLGSLLLMARERGELGSLHQPIADMGWPLRGKDRHITWHQLLNMTSGYGRAEPPGAAWAYNDFAVALFGRSFERLTGRTADELAADYLAPLELDNPALFGTRQGLGIDASVSDLARIGLWWRHLGRWAGTQLVLGDVMAEFMAPVVPRDLPRTRAASDTYLGLDSFGGSTDQTGDGPGHFGNGWWFNTPFAFSSPGLAWPDLPSDTFMSTGHWGAEMVAVFPALELVVVWRSSDRWVAEDYGLGDSDSRINSVLADLVRAVEPSP